MISFIKRNDVANAQGLYAVRLRICKERQRRYFSLNIFADNEYWDEENECFRILKNVRDKKQKEELERVVKNISVLARQSNIHMMIVLQSAGTENINSTTRSNLTKVLLGNAQSNILSATFGTGVDLPCVNTMLSKGQGLIALDRITILRVPMITDMENFKEVVDCGAVG